MKYIFFLFLLMANFSSSLSFAGCTYHYEHSSASQSSDYEWNRSITLIEKSMKKRGFVLIDTSEPADFTLDTHSFWNKYKEEVQHRYGDSTARVILRRNADFKTIHFDQSLARASFLNLGIGKDYSAFLRLKSVLKNIPHCEQAQTLPPMPDDA